MFLYDSFIRTYAIRPNYPRLDKQSRSHMASIIKSFHCFEWIVTETSLKITERENRAIVSNIRRDT